jgi:23S rRNA pseudouridine1911/1915/1917 synthase
MLDHYSVTVGSEDQGQRLDAFLAKKLPDLSRTRIKCLIEEGSIQIVGIKAEPSLHIKAGMVINAEIPDPTEPEPVGQDIPLDIVFEDEHLLVLNKPPGMVVHPAPGHYENTLVNALIAHCGDSLSGIGGVRRPGLVHRLDKGTSGLIVVAKNDKAHRGLALQFAHRSLKRTYHAIVWGLVMPVEDTIEGNIGRCSTDWRKRAVLAEGGKTAITDYKLIRAFGTLASLIECRLRTGRTHQIRVHLTHRGHPLIGDPQYGKAPRGTSATLLEQLKSPIEHFTRPCLHAARLQFYHPITNDFHEFTAEMHPDLEKVLETLEAFANPPYHRR